MSEKIIIFYPNERILEALQADSLSFVSIDENLCISNFEKGIFQTRQTLSDIECNPFSISEIENFTQKLTIILLYSLVGSTKAMSTNY